MTRKDIDEEQKKFAHRLTCRKLLVFFVFLFTNQENCFFFFFIFHLGDISVVQSFLFGGYECLALFPPLDLSFLVFKKNFRRVETSILLLLGELRRRYLTSGWLVTVLLAVRQQNVEATSVWDDWLLPL